MLRMRHVRVLGLCTVVAVGALAGVAGAAKGIGGGGGGGVVPPPVAGGVGNVKINLTSVALPACTGAETTTIASPATCQTAAPILFDPVVGAIPNPVFVLQGTKARLHMAALDPALFPAASCVSQYTIGSLVQTGALAAAVAPEVGNLADFRTNVLAGSLTPGSKLGIDVVCNFTTAPVLGRRGVVVTPGQPRHTETHWAGVM